MATLRDIKRKIEAVKKTAQITRAMNMVAAAKLRGAQANMEKFHPYADKFREVIERLAAGVEQDGTFELLTPREEVRKIELVLLTADRGLCGSFNNNLIMLAEKFMEEKAAEGKEVTLICAGRKGHEYFRKRRFAIRKRYTGLLNKPNYEDAYNLGREVIELFQTGEADEVYLIYAQFVSMLRQVPTLIRLLPVVPESRGDEDRQIDYIFEPSHEVLLNDLLPNYVYVQILESFYQTAVSEHAARMTAMDNATNNCNEMVRDLTLVFNKARQASITKELMDIVGGAEALKKK
ncbi:ATP synthase F1 subunit gamma [Thermodesulforhabdus norvegica]|uniref:ATP synthase gamma chain n=1 Tax=Thermodesulforhabdus norvegica TaxID=39841 RepID=A0A1I4VCU6_9BACT|nr:ATP synthase F1 subunit gamma [Thermodesulforhabdus norvegica]SFM98995.1 ATP synthase F1 subcomplex gamma subunit [Thermodesulforhabdus norvegica]